MFNSLESLEYTFRLVELDDFPRIYDMEYQSYPKDESASEETMQMRSKLATNYFYCLVDNKNKNTIGFINGTCILSEVITEESMKHHEVEGRILVIHSVVIDNHLRNKGLGRLMLIEYINKLKLLNNIDKILILSKSHLLSFYISVGFKVLKLSNVIHGQEQWFELSYDLIESRYIDQLQIDAFATELSFTGNPAAVVFEHKSDDWMQKLANENNLAETAFLKKLNDDNTYLIRWFTPNSEVALCGHATLASAHALYETKRVASDITISFHTLHSGILTASKQSSDWISLNFPSIPPNKIDYTAEEKSAVIDGLGINESDVVYYGKTIYDYFVEITNESFNKLSMINYSKINELVCRGLIVTTIGNKYVDSTSDKSYDFMSRFFAPRCAINEDPVTGSAHCALTPYWYSKLKLLVDNIDELLAYQDSPRGGILKLKLIDDRVVLSGKCVTAIRSKILL